MIKHPASRAIRELLEGKKVRELVENTENMKVLSVEGEGEDKAWTFKSYHGATIKFRKAKENEKGTYDGNFNNIVVLSIDGEPPYPEGKKYADIPDIGFMSHIITNDLKVGDKWGSYK